MTYQMERLLGRLNYLRRRQLRFLGAYPSRDAAMVAVPKKTLVGYNNKEIVNVSYAVMCRVALWDFPVIYWLSRSLEEYSSVLDAGGHMGTKYRAFHPYLKRFSAMKWTVYDLPEIVRAGRARAADEGLTSLGFVDSINELPRADVLLASGLLQYLDIPFSELLMKVPNRVPHLILNKVAMWDKAPLVTMENVGKALVPYQIRNRKEFLGSLHDMGYSIIDEWQIDPLAHRISTHPELGRWSSVGFYLELRK